MSLGVWSCSCLVHDLSLFTYNTNITYFVNSQIMILRTLPLIDSYFSYNPCPYIEGIKDALCNKFRRLTVGQNCSAVCTNEGGHRDTFSNDCSEHDWTYFTNNTCFTYFTIYGKIGKIGIVDNNILLIELYTTKNNFRHSFFLYSPCPYLEGIQDAHLQVLKAYDWSEL